MDDPTALELLAKDIYERARRRAHGMTPWDSSGSWFRHVVAVIVEEARSTVSATPAADTLRAECERLLRFVAGLDLRTCSLADQRERRERVHAMQRVLR